MIKPKKILAAKIVAAVVLIVGVIMYLFANYIAEQVMEGKDRLADAQRQVDQGDGILSIIPYATDVKKEITDSNQRKIDAGQQLVDEYSRLAFCLHLGGIILVIAAGVIVLALLLKTRQK